MRGRYLRLPLGILCVGYVAASLYATHDSNTPLVDDWIYGTTAIELAVNGHFTTSPYAIPTAIFETLWAWPFLVILEPTFHTLRLSTIALTTASGVALFEILRGSGVANRVSVLLTATYLFNPITFALSVSYMTDLHLVALALVAVAFVMKTERLTRTAHTMALVASFTCALAILSRQIGIVLVPLLLWLAYRTGYLTRHPMGAGVLRLSAIPGTVVVISEVWSRANGLPHARRLANEAVLSSIQELPQALGDTASLIPFYLGLALLSIVGLLVGKRPAANGAAVPMLAFALVVGGAYLVMPPRFPAGDWLSQFGALPMASSHYGVPDSRLGTWIWLLIGVISLVAFCLIGFQLIQRARESSLSEDATTLIATGLYLTLMVGLAGGTVASLGTGVLLDRYLASVVPGAILMAAPLIGSGRRLAVPRILTTVIALAVVGITRDALVIEQAVFDEATILAQRLEIPKDQIDAGAPWTGFHYGRLNPPKFTDLQAGEYWWRDLFGPGTPPDWVVSFSPIEGFEVWQESEVQRLVFFDQRLFVLRRIPLYDR